MPLLLLALLAQVPGTGGGVPVREGPRDWKLLVTENFNIYYADDALLPRARQFGGWFEDARVRLERKVGVEPERVNVFLFRSFHDMVSNSFLAKREPLSSRVRQTQFPDRAPSRDPDGCHPHANHRALALAEPLRDRIFIHCQASDRWNAWFVRHELAHHVQYRKLFPWRVPSWLIALRYPLTASWWFEGGADWMADVYDSAKDQYMRDLASEGLYDLKDLFWVFDTINPYDFNAHYYQGSYFFRFLDEKYGAGTARRVFEAQGEGMPIPMQAAIEDATGKPRLEVEREFAAHLAAQWAPKMDGRGVPTDRLTDSTSYYRTRAWGGRWSPDGKRLAWIGDKDTWPEVYVDGRGLLGWRRGVDVGLIQSPPAWSPDGRQIAVIEWNINRDHLLLLTVDGGIETVHLPFDELYDPAWSPDGDRIAFSALKEGTSDIYVLRLSDRRVTRVTKDEDADSDPAWAPDGRLAWLKEVGGRSILHVDGRAVTKSFAEIRQPEWAPDGRSIVVSADVGGVYDAFAVDPATGRAKRLTRFKGGVSHPQMHPDGTLLFTYYRGRSTDLWRTKVVPQDEPAFDQEERRGWYEQFVKPPPKGEPAPKSRVFGVDLLQAPVTLRSWVQPGFDVQVSDREAENTAYAHGRLIPEGYAAQITVYNTRWWPTFGVNAFTARDDDFYEWRVSPFVDLQVAPTLGTGVDWSWRWRQDRVIGADDIEFLDVGPRASVLFSNRYSYRLRDPSWGWAFGGSASLWREDFGGDRDLSEYYGFFEATYELAHDWFLWGRATYDKLIGRELLLGELLEIDDVVRGADRLEGTDRGAATLELRFPIVRDLLWKPLELIGLGEFLVIKDLRGFLFLQAGFAGASADDADLEEHQAVSAGGGIRLDFSAMPWPFISVRAPLRIEIWGAWVSQEDLRPGEPDHRGEWGFAIDLGF